MNRDFLTRIAFGLLAVTCSFVAYLYSYWTGRVESLTAAGQAREGRIIAIETELRHLVECCKR